MIVVIEGRSSSGVTLVVKLLHFLTVLLVWQGGANRVGWGDTGAMHTWLDLHRPYRK